MLTAITETWATVATAITSMFSSVTELFWDSTNSSLTFVGVLACIMAAVSVMLLVFNLIRSFFPMRG